MFEEEFDYISSESGETLYVTANVKCVDNEIYWDDYKVRDIDGNMVALSREDKRNVENYLDIAIYQKAGEYIQAIEEYEGEIYDDL